MGSFEDRLAEGYVNQTSHPAATATNATEVDSGAPGKLLGSPLARLAADVRAAISNAYYESRVEGQTMETAADRARDAVLAIIAADPTLICPDPNAHALAAAVRKAAAGVTHEQVRHLRAAVDGMTHGPYGTAYSPDDEDPAEYAADCVRQSIAYAKESGWGLPPTRLHQVRGPHDVIVAMTGNGPTSEANAEAIAWLLSAADVLVDVLTAALDPGR